jgi:hypothetical protein
MFLPSCSCMMILPCSCRGLAMVLPCLDMSLPFSCHARGILSLCPCDGTETHLGVPDFIVTIEDIWATPRKPQHAPSSSLETTCPTYGGKRKCLDKAIFP